MYVCMSVCLYVESGSPVDLTTSRRVQPEQASKQTKVVWLWTDGVDGVQVSVHRLEIFFLVFSPFPFPFLHNHKKKRKTTLCLM